MDLFKSRLVVWAAFFALLFAILTQSFSRVVLSSILNGIFLGVMVAVVIVYWPLIWFAFRKGSTDRVSQLALGIGLIWLSIAGQKVYWIVWQAHGMPVSWTANDLLSALTLLAIIGGGLFVTAPGYPSLLPEEERQLMFWGANKKLLICLGALGGLITFAISVLSGDVY